MVLTVAVRETVAVPQAQQLPLQRQTREGVELAQRLIVAAIGVASLRRAVWRLHRASPHDA